MDIQKTLNQKGLRLTRPRKVILEILKSETVPLSPQTIHERSISSDQEIGLVTVYRSLNLMMDLGLVRRVHGQDECHGYVLASPGHSHHIICKICGKAIEFQGGSELTNLLERIQRQTGFIVEDHLLQLQGICPKCQKTSL